MLHSWEKLEECMPKCKSDYLWVVRQWEFKKICFLSFSILCIMGVYYMYNKNEIKIFILQKIYIAKLPYQIVVSVLFLPISYTHRLGIISTHFCLPSHIANWTVPTILLTERVDTLRYFLWVRSSSSFLLPLLLPLVQIFAMALTNVFTMCFLSSSYSGDWCCFLIKKLKLIKSHFLNLKKEEWKIV